MKHKVSLREIMEDDYSPMMADLVRKFEEQYGEELAKIMETVGQEPGRESRRNRQPS
jgi:hypothetical protein